MIFRFLLPLLLLVSSCSRPPEEAVSTAPKAGVLATVGPAEIMAEDFTTYAAERRVADTPEARAALLEEMIDEESLVQQAQAAGLDRTPAFRRAMRQFLTTRLDEKALQPLLARAEIISDAELDTACREAVARFTQPAALRYAWIRLTADEAARPAAVERLKAAADKFHALPADAARIGFGTVAAEFSDDTDTRYQGGDLGWLTEKELASRQPPHIAQAVAALAPGQLSAPLDLPGGVCLVLLTDKRPPALPAPASIRERVRHELIATRRAEATAAFRRTAREAVPVEIHASALEALPLPAAAPASLPLPTP